MGSGHSMIWVFAGAMLASGLSAYTSTVAGRSRQIYAIPQWFMIIEFIGVLASIATILFGFMHLRWYVAVTILLVVMMVIVPLAININTFAFWRNIQPLVIACSIFAATYMWIVTYG